MGRWEGRVVAIKKLRAVLLEMSHDFAQEFEREIKLLRSLRYRHIVAFHGAGVLVPF